MVSLPSLWINGHPLLSFEDLGARVDFEVDAAKKTKKGK